jgi:hypothetical protein
MLILVSGASAEVARTDPRRVGVLLQPGGRTRRALLDDRIWAVDNAGFRGFVEQPFLSRLAQLRGVAGCKFVVAPDVLKDHEATLAMFKQWGPRLRAEGWPVAFVAQNGCTPSAVPWAGIDALFIGGDTEWKLSSVVDDLLLEAAARHKWRHVGRVNTLRRIRHFFGRCDSIDGSGFSRFPRRIWLGLRWVDVQGSRLPL